MVPAAREEATWQSIVEIKRKEWYGTIRPSSRNRIATCLRLPAWKIRGLVVAVAEDSIDQPAAAVVGGRNITLCTDVEPQHLDQVQGLKGQERND